MDLTPILAKRRSVRRFKPEPIPPEDLEKLLFALQRAPTDASAQLYSVLRVRDQALREAIARLSGDQEHVRQAAEFFLFLADVHRLERLLLHRGQKMASWPRTALHFGVLDAGLSAAYLALTAEALDFYLRERRRRALGLKVLERAGKAPVDPKALEALEEGRRELDRP